MDILNNLPKIYAHCPAGCKCETIHRSEFANAATYTPVYPQENGFYRLELGKEYKIFAPNLSECLIMMNTFGFYCDVEDEYAEYVVFKLLAVSETSITYEFAGKRIKETIDVGAVTEYCEVFGASRVYQYNADASIVGLKGDKGDNGDALTEEDKEELKAYVYEAIEQGLDVVLGVQQGLLGLLPSFNAIAHRNNPYADLNYTFYFEEGMTWADWIDSKYNTVNAYADDNTHVAIPYNEQKAIVYINAEDYDMVSSNSHIVADNIYGLYLW